VELGGGGMQWRRDLLVAGFTADEVRQRLRSGELVGVRRGAYLPAGEFPTERVAHHVLLVRAALAELARDAVVSHVSAAVLHGLPIWATPLDRVQVTRSRRSGGRLAAALHVHAAPLDPDEVVVIGDVGVTSLARTVVDLARTLPFEQAVVIADAALYRRLVTRASLEQALARSVRRPGNPAARRVIAFADGRSESVGESRSRVAVHRAGLPAPVLQWEVRSGTGRVLGRVDFGWPELRTVGEFDGRVKYGRLLRPGQDPGDAVFEEKRREDALRDEDLRVTRWTWHDLDSFAPVAQRLRHAFRPA